MYILLTMWSLSLYKVLQMRPNYRFIQRYLGYTEADHLTNLSISFCKCCLSPSLLTLLNTFVSSADFSTLLVILSSKSLLYIKNNKGLNTDPCGTLPRTYLQFETSPSTTTRCLLSVSQCICNLVGHRYCQKRCAIQAVFYCRAVGL